MKEAAARANHELGLLDKERMEAIAEACREIRAGALHEQFVVDEIQGGAGTSTNMNANEVISNRALELLGHEKAIIPVFTRMTMSISASPPTTPIQRRSMSG